MSNLFQQSSLTFGNAKQYIAEQAGKQQTTEMLNRAGRSLQAAIQDWNKFNWKWLLTTATITASTTAGPFNLPYDFKDVYDVYSDGSTPSWIPAVSRRARTRSNYRGLATAPYAYDLFAKGGLGQLALQGGAATSLSLEYYRRMTVPCTVTASGLVTFTNSYWMAGTEGVWAGVTLGNLVTFSTAYALASAQLSTVIVTALRQNIGKVAEDSGNEVTLGGALANTRLSSLHITDAAATGIVTSATAQVGGENCFLSIPETYEWGILARGVEHFMAGVGGPADKMQEWKTQAAVKLEEALRDDREAEDQDICFSPSPSTWSYNPNRIWE